MPQNNKSLPVWFCDQGRYHDVGLDFPYSIIHKIGDTDYLTSGAGGALAEWRVFDDKESLVYFFAVLMCSKVLVPVKFLPSRGRPNSMAIIHAKRGELDARIEYADIGAVDLLPDVKDASEIHQRFLAVFTSVREISHSSDGTVYLYIEFSYVYDWLKKHCTDLDCIAIDLWGRYFTPFDVNKFIEVADEVKRAEMGYSGKNLIHDLRMASLNKHVPKSRKYRHNDVSLLFRTE